MLRQAGPQEAYIPLALLTESAYISSNASAQIQKLRGRAAQMGADALIIQDISPIIESYSSSTQLTVTALAVAYPRLLPSPSNLSEHLWVRRWEVWDSTGTLLTLKKELFAQNEVLMQAGTFGERLLTLLQQTSPTETIYNTEAHHYKDSYYRITNTTLNNIKYIYSYKGYSYSDSLIREISIRYPGASAPRQPERTVTNDPMIPGYDDQKRMNTLTMNTLLFGKVQAEIVYTTDRNWSSITYWDLGADGQRHHKLFRVSYVRPTAKEIEQLLAGETVIKP